MNRRLFLQSAAALIAVPAIPVAVKVISVKSKSKYNLISEDEIDWQSPLTKPLIVKLKNYKIGK